MPEGPVAVVGRCTPIHPSPPLSAAAAAFNYTVVYDVDTVECNDGGESVTMIQSWLKLLKPFKLFQKINTMLTYAKPNPQCTCCGKFHAETLRIIFRSMSILCAGSAEFYTYSFIGIRRCKIAGKIRYKSAATFSHRSVDNSIAFPMAHNQKESLSSSMECSPVSRVVIFGGTHGNEMSGVTLVKHWLKDPSELHRTTFMAEPCLANPLAVEKCVRYIDRDLNRSFSEEVLRSFLAVSLVPTCIRRNGWTSLELKSFGILSVHI
ncbi:unnamed protein product [Ranitomeya imitator]|uniref:Succinylglutamate desuccinylase/Aspartoacylase catalytic domain-containing protein n=1 Tax=Ranitomeya imitator TaxID=111125 RepID=A0ABN9LPI6_9NEOB|nr:unnamed protein product [Ranitomeya imitator]